MVTMNNTYVNVINYHIYLIITNMFTLNMILKNKIIIKLMHVKIKNKRTYIFGH